ncbi:hypothetical protein HWV62_39003 [Athelia sp. TMB]|nr:hypothetical protein HWV62_39003 [Athelia sp. TMB]
MQSAWESSFQQVFTFPNLTHEKLQNRSLFVAMELINRPNPSTIVAQIPPITIFNPLELNRSLPASLYTLMKTDDLRTMYTEITKIQTYLHNLVRDSEAGLHGQSLGVNIKSKQARPTATALQRVPPEVMSIIFTQLSHPINKDDEIDIPPIAQILLPGQICRSWRAVALSTPGLWASLKIDLLTEKKLPMWTTCLTRAKNHPLSIAIQCFGSESTVHSHPIIPVLLAHAHQWCNLALDRTSSCLVCAEFRAARGNLPMLRRVQFDCFQIEDIGSFDTFQTSPKLLIVHLSCLETHQSAQGQRFPLLPWRQLQKITFNGSVDAILDILQESPDLRVLDVTTRGEESQRERGSSTRNHSLHDLRVNDCNGDSSTLFLSLALPALQVLSLNFAGCEFPGDEIISFVVQSKISHSLEVLSLSFGRYHYGSRPITKTYDIIRCLKSMPNVSDLSLHDRGKSNYLETFEGRDTVGDITLVLWDLRWDIEAPVLPNLKRFAIKGPITMSWSIVQEMVTSRWRGVSQAAGDCVRLESAEVNWLGACAHPKSALTRLSDSRLAAADASVLACLRLYRDEGLRVMGPIDEVDSECVECAQRRVYEDC